MQRFTLAFLLLIFTSALNQSKAQTQKTPFQYSDELTAISDNIDRMGHEWGRLLSSAYTSKDFKPLSYQRQKMEAYILSEIRRLQTAKEVGVDAKYLKAAMIRFLFFEQAMLKNAFLPLENLTASAPEEEIKKAMSLLQVYAKEEYSETAKWTDAQDAYARKNGLVTETSAEGK
jgi:hypothetical protein